MIATLRPHSFADLQRMPDDLFRYKILDGELIASAASPAAHHRVHGALLRIIDAHARQSQAGEVIIGPFYVVLGHYDAVPPNLVFLSASRPQVPDDATYLSHAPDMIAEVISPSTRAIDLVRKMALYARSGVPEYWIADPDGRELVINVLRDDEYAPAAPVTDVLIASPTLTGLRVDPAEVFAGLK